MPVDRVAAFQLGCLLLAVPVQYLVSSYTSGSYEQRTSALMSILRGYSGFKDRYLTWKSWHTWCQDILAKVSVTERYEDSGAVEGESPAIEVMKFRDPGGHFSASPVPRNPREPHIKYRVGQVIKHKVWGYRGVIVGWDSVAKAPDWWIKQMHPKDKSHWRKQPNYSILVDTRDRLQPQTTYIPEENIEILSNTRHWKRIPHYAILVDSRDRNTVQTTYVVEESIDIIANMRVIHPAIDDYFEDFDGAQYLPRPAIRTLYPHD